MIILRENKDMPDRKLALKQERSDRLVGKCAPPIGQGSNACLNANGQFVSLPDSRLEQSPNLRSLTADVDSFEMG
jgi:hypothetical protein